jgi:hypothetical protein
MTSVQQVGDESKSLEKENEEPFVKGELVEGDVEAYGNYGDEKMTKAHLDSISLEWSNISYVTSAKKDKESKMLIHPMSGCALPGEMLALMGSSGGK